MSEQWKNFLAQQGASFNSENQSSYANVVSDNDSTMTDLLAYGLLSVKGPDAAKFLQGQFTCDFDEISPELSLTGAYCTPKGRMISSFRVIQLEDDHYMLRMRSQILEETKKVLDKYGVFFKAEVNICEGIVGLGLTGTQAKTALAQQVSALPDKQNGCLAIDGHAIVQLDDTGERFECWIRASEAETLWQEFSNILQVVGSESWDLLNIRAGIGEVRQQTIETFIPQMLNLQAIGSISFKKGCYTGQEIVARAHYRGQVKRRMIYALTKSTAKLEAGSDLLDDAGKAVGTVVSSAKNQDGDYELLGVISLSKLEQPLKTSTNTTLQVMSLPYESELQQ